VLSAIDEAHAAELIHRDLKPDNIIITPLRSGEDFVKVLDFGIAKVGHGPTRLTRAGEVLGTPHYMSPEQCEGEGVDHRTDIYALGVLLYEMVTGHVPHDADTMMGILTKHMYEEPIPPSVRVPHISQELEILIMRCLEKLPERRYQTMHSVLADLERVRSGLRPVGPDTWNLPETRPPRPWIRRVSPVYAGGFALTLLVLIGSILMTLGAEPEPKVQEAVLTPPEPKPAKTVPSRPTPLLPPPILSPLMGPDQLALVESGDLEAKAKAKPRPKSAAKKPVRRKPRRKPKPAQSRDRTILDPWN
jgi:serine/threonine protein kinase